MSIIDQGVIDSIAHDDEDRAFIGKRFREYETAYAAAKAHAEARDNAEERALQAWLGEQSDEAQQYAINETKIDRLTAELERLTAENSELWDAVSEDEIAKVADSVSGDGADVTTALRTAASNLRKVIDMATDGLPEGVTVPGRIGKSGGTGQRQVGGMGKPRLSRIVLDGKDIEPSGEHPTLTDLSKLVNVSTKVLSDALFEANGQVRDVPTTGTGHLMITVNGTQYGVQLFSRERDTSAKSGS